MSAVRLLAVAAAVVLAVVLQVSFFSHLAIAGVVPNVALLVVVAAGLARGPEFAMVLGFAAGALLDLAPPAEHLAGRWALALLVVGLVAGLMRSGARPSLGSGLATVAACSFIGTSLYSLTGLLLGEAVLGVATMIRIIAIALAWDVLLALLVLPAAMWAFRALSARRVAW